MKWTRVEDSLPPDNPSQKKTEERYLIAFDNRTSPSGKSIIQVQRRNSEWILCLGHNDVLPYCTCGVSMNWGSFEKGNKATHWISVEDVLKELNDQDTKSKKE